MGLSKSQINALITYVDNEIPPRVRRILQSFGTNAHLYLPGVGVIDGFTAGNYQDSSGTTAGAVDSVVGLALDGVGSVGSDLLSGAGSFNSATGWTTQAGWSVSGGQLVASNVAQFSNTQRVLTLTQGKTYKITLSCTSTNGGTYYIVRPDATNGPNWTGVGTNSFIYTHGAGSSNLYVATGTAGFSGTFDNLVVQEVTGTHASQSTTANKPLLKSSGGKYYWQFDGSNDSLALGSVPFQMSDDHCVIAAANASSLDGVNRRIFTQENGTPTTCEIEASSTALSIVWRDNAGTLSAVASTVSAGSAFVVTGVKKGNAKTGRKNGTSFGTDSTAMGATTLGASPYIGNRAASDRPFAGNIYCLIAIKGTVSDADIAVLEKWAGRLAGVTI